MILTTVNQILLSTLLIIFSIYDFLRRSRKKNKYRWFKVEGFGDGLVVVGKFQGVRCPLSAVRCHKGFYVLNSASQPSPCKRPRARRQPIPPQSYSISKLQS